VSVGAALAMTRRERIASWLDAAFPATFWAFVAMTVGILLLALVPALVPVPPPTDRMPADAAEQLALMFGRTALKTEDPGTLAVDYGLSVLNLAVALLLFLRRPRDPVARLLSVAMVGTALALTTRLMRSSSARPRSSPGPSRVERSCRSLRSSTSSISAITASRARPTRMRSCSSRMDGSLRSG
jgi:hypothetical protein